MNKQAAHLFFATFNIQVGMGYLGINFLRKEQSRRNQLVQMDIIGDQEEGTNNGSNTDGEQKVCFNKISKPYLLFNMLAALCSPLFLVNVFNSPRSVPVDEPLA